MKEKQRRKRRRNRKIVRWRVLLVVTSS